MVMKVKKQPRQLQTSWTVDLRPGEITYGEDLENEIAKILRQEIEWEIQSNFLKSQGWTPIYVNYTTDEIISWCQLNIKNRYEFLGSNWMFEKSNDASHFILKWS